MPHQRSAQEEIRGPELLVLTFFRDDGKSRAKLHAQKIGAILLGDGPGNTADDLRRNALLVAR